MSKLEEVTRALATDQMRRTLAAAGLEYEPGQDAFLRDFAIAAIKAMREPTDWMLTKGCCYEDDVPSILMGDGIVAGNVWRAMCDAALREEGR